MPPSKPTKRAAKPPRNAARKPAPEISDHAVAKATGRTTAQWFAILDAFANKQGGHQHAPAAQHISTAYACPPWWSQMVTVLYERDRGHRVKHQRPDGFAVSASRTVNAPLPALYQAWTGRARAQWLDEPFTVRKATENKSIRITWDDGTNVEAMFYPKGESKSQVSVQHSKLKTAAAGARAKKQWAQRLDALKQLVEK